MNAAEFKSSIDADTPPSGIGAMLTALWYDARRDWHRSHEIVQDIGSQDAAWIHAYLHRKEGDLSNAAYWYRRANKPMAEGSLDTEWNELVAHFVER